MLVPESRHEEAKEIAKKTAEATKVGDPFAEDTGIGPVVSDVQFNKIQGLIEKGIDSEYFNSMLYEETFNSGKLAFDGTNYYWVDPKGRVIKTEQYIHPRLPKVVIEFYFK